MAAAVGEEGGDGDDAVGGGGLGVVLGRLRSLLGEEFAVGEVVL